MSLPYGIPKPTINLDFTDMNSNVGIINELQRINNTGLGTVDFGALRATRKFTQNRLGLISEAPLNIPALSFDKGVAKGFLAEGGATNLFLQSQTFNVSPWDLFIGTIVSTTEIAPDGTATATKLRMGAGGAAFVRQVVGGLTAGNNHTISLFIKQVTGTSAFLDIGDAKEVADIFPTNQWVRYDSTEPWNGSAQYCDLEFRGADGVAEVLIWGAQLETGSVASSYIPTTTGTVARSADTFRITGASGAIGQTEGTILIQSDLRNNPARLGGSRFIELTDGTDNNRILIATSNTLIVQFFVGAINGAEQASITSALIPEGVVKIGATYSSNYFALFVNGVKIGEDLSGVVPATNQIAIGCTRLGTAQLQDSIGYTRLLKQRLSDELLQLLTRP